MANVELGSSNLKEVYDAINSNSGGSADTTNLAKLNEANTFTVYQTFQQPINVMSQANLNGEVGISGNFYVYSDTIEIGKATTGGLNIQTADNSVTMNLADTCALTVENRLKTELQRELEINPVDTSSFAQLTSNNTFTGENVFTGSVGIQNFIPLTNPTVANPKEWATLVDNDIPTKKQIVDITDNKVSKTGPETIEGVKTFSSIPLCQHTPTNGDQLANKDYVDSVVGSGGGIPLSISNQTATYDATTLNSVKWNFGTDAYSQLGTHDIDLVTKTSRLDKTSNVIIGDSGCYAIPDEIIPMFGDSMKEMGSIPIGLSVTHAGTNVGGLGIGGHSSASVLWGGNGRSFLAITTDQVTLTGDSAIGNAGFTIAGGGVIFHAPNSLNFNLSNSGTLTMSAKMISELKRLLGI